MASQVHFKLQGSAESLGVGPATGDRQTFVRGDIDLTLEMEVNAQGRETGDCLVEASVVRLVSDDASAGFRQRLSDIAAQASAPRRAVLGPYQSLVLPEHLVGWFVAPEPVVLLCRDIQAELEGEARRMVQLLRWVFNRPSPAIPLADAVMRWSLDGEQWELAPTSEEEYLPVGNWDELEVPQALVARLLESEVAEPIARQIFLEAVALRDHNPRAAFIVGFAAAEIGIKQFAMQQSDSPSEAWLLDTAPAPPITKLLGGYLPRLTERRTADLQRAIPTSLGKLFEGAMQKRNKLTHSEEPAPTEVEVATLLNGVNDLLYLLDWFSGHDWAFAHVGDKTKASYAPGFPA